MPSRLIQIGARALWPAMKLRLNPTPRNHTPGNSARSQEISRSCFGKPSAT